jgi:alpha-beta hydrolase superfamily lysophospholipase
VFSFASLDGVMLEGAYHRSRVGDARGAIVQAHGITADMDEGGMFVQLAARLAAAGFDVLRFSFRGHGRSGGTQTGMTIAGEMLDLQAALTALTDRSSAPVSIVAASFSAASTCLVLPYLDEQLQALVLWNPTLDLRRTFIEPELPWGQRNFNASAVARLKSDGFFLLDGEYRIGRALYEELKAFRPLERFVASPLQSAIVHGDRDTYVPYDVSARAAEQHRQCELITIEGADHGFDPDKEDDAIAATVAWLDRVYA